MRQDHRASRSATAAVIGVAAVVVAGALPASPAFAGIQSTGDVKPPFALVDTIGSTKTFTVPTDPSSTGGGVYVGDTARGTLTIDNGWTLNSTFGTVANQQGSAFPSGSQVDVTGNSTWNTTFDFDVGYGSVGFANIRFGSAVSAGQSIRVGTLAGSAGIVEVDANSSLSSAGGTFVGESGGGSIVVQAGSSLENDFLTLGVDNNSSGAVHLGGAATLETHAGVFVGGRGTGELTVYEGSQASARFTLIGNDGAVATGASGIVPLDNRMAVAGVGSYYTNAEGFGVGYNTKGTLSVGDHATLETGYLEVSRYGTDGRLNLSSGGHILAHPGPNVSAASVIFAAAAGSEASGLISDAGTTLVVTGPGSFFEVGRGGSATLDVTHGAVVTTGYSLVATDPGSVGVLNLADADTRFTASDSIEIGRGGTATATISNGALLSTTNFLIVGSNAGSNGTLTLTGSAGTTPSHVMSAAQMVAGINGSGSLNVLDGARLDTLKNVSPTATSGILAQFAGSTGSVTVSGIGSLWHNDGGVNVGFRGQGTLNVGSGGRVESTDGVIARLPGSVGVVTVGGANARWAVDAHLYVGGRPASSVSGSEGLAGPGGTATLNVNAGGAVTVGNDVRLFAGSTIDLTGGGSLAVASAAPAETSTLHVYSAGTLRGSGTVKGNLQTTGTITTSVSSATAYDRLTFTGTATLGGTLAISLASGLSLAPSDRLDVITANSVSGRFSTVTGNRLGATQWLSVLYRPTKVTLALAATGDANLDGTIGFDDLLALAKHYNQSGPGIDWTVGDFDGNSVVNFDDLLALAKRYNTTTAASGGMDAPISVAADWALAQSLVPEPTAASIVVAACSISGRRRRRR